MDTAAKKHSKKVHKGGKKEPEKNRQYERDRRNRLNKLFEELHDLLPGRDKKTDSKNDTLEKAKKYITKLKGEIHRFRRFVKKCNRQRQEVISLREKFLTSDRLVTHLTKLMKNSNFKIPFTIQFVEDILRLNRQLREGINNGPCNKAAYKNATESTNTTILKKQYSSHVTSKKVSIRRRRSIVVSSKIKKNKTKNIFAKKLVDGNESANLLSLVTPVDNAPARSKNTNNSQLFLMDCDKDNIRSIENNFFGNNIFYERKCTLRKDAEVQTDTNLRTTASRCVRKKETIVKEKYCRDRDLSARIICNARPIHSLYATIETDFGTSSLASANEANNGLSIGMNNGIGNGMNDGMSTGLNNGISNGVNNGISNGFINRMSNGLNNGPSNGLNNGPSNGLNNGMSNGLNNGISNGVNNGINNGVNNGISNGVNNGISNGVNNGMNNGLNNGPSNGLNNGPSNGLNNGPSNGLNNGISNEVNNGISNGVNNGMSNGVNNGISNGVNNGISNGVNNGLNNGPSNGLNNGPSNGLNNGISNEANNGISNGVNNGMSNRINDGTNNGISWSVNRMTAFPILKNTHSGESRKKKSLKQDLLKCPLKTWSVDCIINNNSNNAFPCVSNEIIGTDDLDEIAPFQYNIEPVTEFPDQSAISKSIFDGNIKICDGTNPKIGVGKFLPFNSSQMQSSKLPQHGNYSSGSQDYRDNMISYTSGSQDYCNNVINYASCSQDYSTNIVTYTSGSQDYHNNVVSYTDRNNTMNYSSGSQDNRNSIINRSSGGQDNRNSIINRSSGGQDNRNSIINRSPGSHDNRNSIINLISSGQDNRNSIINRISGGQDNRNSIINSGSGGQDNSNSVINCGSGNQDNRDNIINYSSGGQDNRNGVVNCGSGSRGNRNNIINYSGGSHDYFNIVIDPVCTCYATTSVNNTDVNIFAELKGNLFIHDSTVTTFSNKNPILAVGAEKNKSNKKEVWGVADETRKQVSSEKISNAEGTRKRSLTKTNCTSNFQNINNLQQAHPTHNFSIVSLCDSQANKNAFQENDSSNKSVAPSSSCECDNLNRNNNNNIDISASSCNAKDFSNLSVIPASSNSDNFDIDSLMRKHSKQFLGANHKSDAYFSDDNIASMDDFALRNTELADDLLSTLQNSHDGSISPTAAFLLSFPLVSTSKSSESNNAFNCAGLFAGEVQSCAPISKKIAKISKRDICSDQIKPAKSTIKSTLADSGQFSLSKNSFNNNNNNCQNSGAFYLSHDLLPANVSTAGISQNFENNLPSIVSFTATDFIAGLPSFSELSKPLSNRNSNLFAVSACNWSNIGSTSPTYLDNFGFNLTGVTADYGNPISNVKFVSNSNGNLLSNGKGNSLNNTDGNFISDSNGDLISNSIGNLISNDKGNSINNIIGNLVSNSKGNSINNINGNLISNSNGNLISNSNSNLTSNSKGNSINNINGNVISNSNGNLLSNSNGNLLSNSNGEGAVIRNSKLCDSPTSKTHNQQLKYVNNTLFERELFDSLDDVTSNSTFNSPKKFLSISRLVSNEDSIITDLDSAGIGMPANVMDSPGDSQKKENSIHSAESLCASHNVRNNQNANRDYAVNKTARQNKTKISHVSKNKKTYSAQNTTRNFEGNEFTSQKRAFNENMRNSTQSTCGSDKFTDYIRESENNRNGFPPAKYISSISGNSVTLTNFNVSAIISEIDSDNAQ